MPPLSAPSIRAVETTALSSNVHPRVIIYYQTHFHPGTDDPISILPLVNQPGPSVTHIIVAAIHLNDEPGHITLNDHVPTHPRNATLWAELHCAKACGVRLLGMLGGAARGTYARLDQGRIAVARFEAFYTPLRDWLRTTPLEGLDLDVEEDMSLAGIEALIDRLRADFGPEFLITLAPVAPALQPAPPAWDWSRFRRNLSGFEYAALEASRGHEIAWYNAQFYCGWGDVASVQGYLDIVEKPGQGGGGGRLAGGGAPSSSSASSSASPPFPPEKIVLGMITNPANGDGWKSEADVTRTIRALHARYGSRFGGVMGWEYFNALPGGKHRPWEWAYWLAGCFRGQQVSMKGQARVADAVLIEDGDVAAAEAAETVAETTAETAAPERDHVLENTGPVDDTSALDDGASA